MRGRGFRPERTNDPNIVFMHRKVGQEQAMEVHKVGLKDALMTMNVSESATIA